jgi:hypothetical protein
MAATVDEESGRHRGRYEHGRRAPALIGAAQYHGGSR